MKKKKEEQGKDEMIGTPASIHLPFHLKEIKVDSIGSEIGLRIHLVTGTQEQVVAVLMPQEKAKEIAGKIFEVIGGIREMKRRVGMGF